MAKCRKRYEKKKNENLRELEVNTNISKRDYKINNEKGKKMSLNKECDCIEKAIEQDNTEYPYNHCVDCGRLLLKEQKECHPARHLIGIYPLPGEHIVRKSGEKVNGYYKFTFCGDCGYLIKNAPAVSTARALSVDVLRL